MAKAMRAPQSNNRETVFVEQVIRLDDYQAHPRNYNRHPAAQIERLRVSLRKFGQPRNIVVWRGFFVAGHGVAQAAMAEGWETLRANVIPDDWPAERVLAFLAADNELGRLSDPDEAALAQILDESRNFDAELMQAIGYDDKEFEALLAEVGALPTDSEWGNAMGGLPTEDRAPFQQMTFTLHDSQAEQVKRAMAVAAKMGGDFTNSPNQNGNGNALALICETFVTDHDNS